ncbi:MAG: LysM peptidoglycan-binding domain-containing protein [Thermoflexales bacterium]|nr:LysM peptidoglycan-binding domain-containing protein [Thermoflexales bacterium]
MLRSVPRRGTPPLFSLAVIFAGTLLLVLLGVLAILSVLVLRGALSLPAAEGMATPPPGQAIAAAPPPEPAAPREVPPVEAPPTPELPPTSPPPAEPPSTPVPPPPEPTPAPAPTPKPPPPASPQSPPAEVSGPDPFPIGAPAVPSTRVTCNRRITHVVRPGENLFRIALRYNTTAQSIANLNDIPDVRQIRAGQRLVVVTCAGRASRGRGRTYVVQPGDTLFRVALNHGTTVSALRAANGLRSNLIYPGQVLRIP